MWIHDPILLAIAYEIHKLLAEHRIGMYSRNIAAHWTAVFAACIGLLLNQIPSHAVEAASGRRLRVGSTQQYKTPSAAAAAAQDGDTIEIEADEYAGDVAVWSANRLTIRGVNGMAHVAAHGKSAQQKAIWVIRGNDTTVEHIEFSGCRVPDRNGAGIRQEGRGLVVRH